MNDTNNKSPHMGGGLAHMYENFVSKTFPLDILHHLNNKDIILELYKQLRLTIDSINERKKTESVSVGNRLIIAEKFESTLKKFFEENKHHLKIRKVHLHPKLEYKDEYQIHLKPKEADIMLILNNGDKVVIEVKTTLEFNALGAAYLEALITKSDKFFIFSLTTKSEQPLKLAANTPLSKLISAVVVLNPHLKYSNLQPLDNFFQYLTSQNH